MARSSQATISTDPYSFTLRPLVLVLLIGAATGALGWLINLFLQHYFIQPVFCASGDSSGVCSNGSVIAWALAQVLVVGASVVAMVGALIYRPLLVALAALITVWGIHTWLNDLSWWSATLWQAAIFALAYATYTWIARTMQFWVAALITIVVIVICRLILNFA